MKPGPDPHVARPKAHARCEAPPAYPSPHHPLTYLPQADFTTFDLLQSLNFKEIKKTGTAYLLFSSTYFRWPILSSVFLLIFILSPPFPFPSFFSLPFLSFPFLFYLILFLSSPFFLFPPLKTIEGQWWPAGPLKGSLRRKAPWGARPKVCAFCAFKGIRYWVRVRSGVMVRGRWGVIELGW